MAGIVAAKDGMLKVVKEMGRQAIIALMSVSYLSLAVFIQALSLNSIQ